MSEQNINAWCSICGTGYHVCNSCHDQKSFTPWRVVTDSMAHYMIYTIIHEYTKTKNKELAASELSFCDLSEYTQFKPEIRRIIDDILSSPDASKNLSPDEKIREKTSNNKQNLNE